MVLEGRAWKLGDNIDTDQLVPGRYLSLTDPRELAVHCLEETVPHFRELAQPGDIVVAGENFGCGSSREHAPVALKALGISCLVAISYARIFFRNCINLGLPALTSADAFAGIEDRDRIRIDLEAGVLENLTRPFHCPVPPISPFLLQIIDVGGLTPYIRRRLDDEKALPRVERRPE